MRISDWSSDVCSSDLVNHLSKAFQLTPTPFHLDKLVQSYKVSSLHIFFLFKDQSASIIRYQLKLCQLQKVNACGKGFHLTPVARSEERRVGNECVMTFRSRGSTYT